MRRHPAHPTIETVEELADVSLTVARLGLALFTLPGQRGSTPAFGYGPPHPGARGTLTLLISALSSAHYDPLRFSAWPPTFSTFEVATLIQAGPPTLP
jgi:hypothetical protein